MGCVHKSPLDGAEPLAGGGGAVHEGPAVAWRNYNRVLSNLRVWTLSSSIVRSWVPSARNRSRNLLICPVDRAM